MAEKICWFCGASREDVEFDKEHVLPWGLRDLEPTVGDWESTTGFHGRDEPATYKFGNRGPIVDLQTRSVCKSNCNGGWMRELEGAAQPLIRSLATGEPRILTGTERRTLARWSIKTAYVHESIDKASRVSTPAQRRKFMEVPTDIGPHRVTMFLTEKPSRMLHRATLFRGTKHDPDFWIFSDFIRISHLAVQVWIRSVAAYPGQDALDVPIHRDGVVMWPPEGLLTRWPPKRRISDHVALGLSGGAMALLPAEQFQAYRDETKRLAAEDMQP
jgi:hypothetical protein